MSRFMKSPWFSFFCCCFWQAYCVGEPWPKLLLNPSGHRAWWIWTTHILRMRQWMLTRQETFAGEGGQGQPLTQEVRTSSVAIYMTCPLLGRCCLANVSCEYGPHTPLNVYGSISKFDQMLLTYVTHANTCFWWNTHLAGLSRPLFHVPHRHSCNLHSFVIP